MPQTAPVENVSKQQNLSQLPVNADPKKVSRELGLEIASLCGRHFLKINHLHYGYWPEDLEVDITNLHIAQDRYTDFLIEHIPPETKTILDVGCGSGQNAKKITEAGCDIDCVSPSPNLANNARDLLGPGHEIYVSYYETLQTDKRYDLILFSESFQYMKIEAAIKKSWDLLNDGGCMLICDAFKKDVKEKCPLSGGHYLKSFNEIISRQPFELLKDVDITEQTAPNIDLENKMLMEVGAPAWGLFNQLMDSRYPLMAKLLRWKYRKKIAKVQRKYFSGQKSGENFRKFKSYRLFIYKKTDAAAGV
ncbi:MAG: class I SAM-dependent methyltransferase [Planctomycetota bacterium]